MRKRRRLSKIHVTVKSEGRELLLFDGSAIKPSTNGSAFNGKALSAQKPIRLIEPGELKLANTYSIRMIPLLEESNGAPAIANLEDWRGPNNDNDSNTSLRGAVLFMANEKSDAGLTVWLFSTAAFGSSTVSPIDFTSSAKIAALRYFRGCFWIEQRSTESLLLDGLALGRGEIAPLAAGQTLEVKGSKYAVEIQDPGKQQKSLGSPLGSRLISKVCQVLLQGSLDHGVDLGIVFPIQKKKAARSQGKFLQCVDRRLEDRMKRKRRRITQVGGERLSA